MNISFEQRTQILAKYGISPSREEDILIEVKDLTTPPEANKELAFKESCTSDGEQLFEQEVKKDKEAISDDLNQNRNQAYERFIDTWFQESTW